MTLSPRFLDELRSRVTLSDFVGRKVRLTRAGREFKGCCPFHNEKTPSFYVNDDKNFYHCFGCGAHGDVIGFAMQHDNLSFIEAVETLASEAGLEVPKSSPQEIEKAKKQKSLYTLIEDATQWMEIQLREPQNIEAYRYMLDRGHHDEQLSRFRIGYAPADRQVLRNVMKEKGYTDKDMIEAGLLRPGNNGKEPYAFFRERIMFPVADRRGRVVAFGGRILPDHLRPPDRGDYVPAKYMNSADNALFHKGHMLYGQGRARQAVADGQPLLVVEGYVDVMACVKAGFEGAVAPLGTALTEDQIILLWKMISHERKEPILCFDGDNAGRRAALRAVERILPLLKPNQSAKIAFLPQGQDPDSLIKSEGSQAFQTVLNHSLSLVDFLWHSHTSGERFDTPEQRAGLSKALEDRSLMIADRDIQHYYRQAFREKTQKEFRSNLLPNSLKNRHNRGSYQAQNQGIVSIKRPRFTRPEDKLIAAMINHPAIYEHFEEEFGLLVVEDKHLDNMRQDIITHILENPGCEKDNIINALKGKSYAQYLNKLLSQEIYALARFARPSAELDEVIEGWRQLYQSIAHNTNISQEIKNGNNQ
ncbi:MAG: DNA primase [Pseudomonadota bacterium]